MLNKITGHERKALSIATACAVVIGLFFMKHYLMLIITASIMAFLFNPVYKRLLKKGMSKQKSAGITLAVTFIAIIIPLIFIISISAAQIASVSKEIGNSQLNTNVNELLQHLINSINQFLAKIGVSYQLTEATIRESLSAWLKNVLDAFLASLGSFVSGIGSFVATMIIYLYVFMSLLINQDKLTGIFYQLNPLGSEMSKLYAKKIQLMTKAMVRGQFVIAFVQGMTDTIFLYIVGFHSLFFFFAIILTVLSIIPLGAGVIVFPIGAIMLLTGHIWQGLLLILGHMFIVGNEDNIMRPKLVPAEARLDPALTLLSVFSGMAFFGFIGIILGPVIMIVIVTTIQVYLEVFKNVVQTKQIDSKGGRFNKLKFWKRPNKGEVTA